MKQEYKDGYLYYRMFQFMWLTFLGLHTLVISNKYLVSGPTAIQWIYIPVLASIGLSLWNPRNIRLFILSLLLTIIMKVILMPFIPNHFILVVAVMLTLLFGLLFYWKKELESEERIGYWFNKVMPFIRLQLLLVYFFAVLHKLNYDFFIPSVSCGSELYLSIAERYFFIPFPQGEWILWVTIIGTLILEVIIPVFLVFPATRILGLVIGGIFHLLLAIHPNINILSFTSEVFAIYVLFLSPDLLKSLWKRGVYLLNLRSLKQFPLIGSGLFLLIGLVYIFLFGSFFPEAEGDFASLDRRRHHVSVFMHLLIWYPIYIFLFINFFLTAKGNLVPASSGYGSLKKSLLFIFPLLIIFNGMTPYLGLKTALNFSMFSNLRVQGSDNNHLFMPSNIQLTDYQTDLVEILDTSHERLKEHLITKQRITYFELKRIISETRHQTFFLNYKRNGEIFELDFPNEQKEGVLEGLPLMAEKLLIFRAVPESGPCPCQW